MAFITKAENAANTRIKSAVTSKYGPSDGTTSSLLARQPSRASVKPARRKTPIAHAL
jgi:hypothetical protein